MGLVTSSCRTDPPALAEVQESALPAGLVEPTAADFARQVIEAHAGLSGDGAAESSAYPASSPPRPAGDLSLYEGERRCVVAHFRGASTAREAAEKKLLSLWDLRQDWVAKQRERAAGSPADHQRSEAIAQRRFDQVCPGGRPSAPFLAQISE